MGVYSGPRLSESECLWMEDSNVSALSTQDQSNHGANVYLIWSGWIDPCFNNTLAGRHFTTDYREILIDKRFESKSLVQQSFQCSLLSPSGIRNFACWSPCAALCLRPSMCPSSATP